MNNCCHFITDKEITGYAFEPSKVSRKTKGKYSEAGVAHPTEETEEDMHPQEICPDERRLLTSSSWCLCTNCEVMPSSR